MLKEINSYDEFLTEKLALVEQLDKKEKQAFFTMLDALVSKKRLRDSLNTVLQDVG